MISICVPVFNQNLSSLLEELYSQQQTLNFKTEVLIYEDGSYLYTNINEKKCLEYHFTHIWSKENMGRVKSRLHLANKSRYDWILFIDADMFPSSKRYLSNYFSATISKQAAKVIFGGYAYDKKKRNNFLRSHYGKRREQKPAFQRAIAPYKYVFSGNMLIQKEIFIRSSIVLNHSYGLDMLLGAELFKKKVTVQHIENETLHLGIDTNEVYLKKLKNGSVQLRKLYDQQFIPRGHNKLIKFYENLKSLRLISILCSKKIKVGRILFVVLSRYGKPLFLLDWYRLYYFSNPEAK